jgi:hypothetical protein
MNISDAVSSFVAQSRHLCEVLRVERQKLTDIDLHRVRAELHLLEMETSNLQTYKDLNLSLDLD